MNDKINLSREMCIPSDIDFKERLDDLKEPILKENILNEIKKSFLCWCNEDDEPFFYMEVITHFCRYIQDENLNRFILDKFDYYLNENRINNFIYDLKEAEECELATSE